jgi:Met-zincin/Domain of unknown function (DUF5117)
MPIHSFAPRLSLLATASLLAACATPSGTSPAQKAAPTASVAPVASVFNTAPALPVAAPPAGAAPVAPGAARPPGAAAAPVAPPAPGTPPPFATVIKDAKKIEGPLVFWQKDDKVWIELGPEQFGQPYLLSPKFKNGIGEAFVLGGLMAYPVNGAGGMQVVEFVRVHNTVRLQARNQDVTAKPGTPEARAVASSYSASLLGSTPVASQPHTESKRVLIEANGLFLSDMLGVGMMLQRNFRQGYALDGRNTVITAVRGTPQASIIETQNHYYTANIATAQPGQPPGAPVPTVPRFLPDTRSMLVGHHYSLAPLPAVPMAMRKADPRVGLFTTTLLDFSDDLSRRPNQRYVDRWRLEKKDPAAELSEPVKPITFWIDRNVPLAYRETVRSGILEWNKAFERIGFKDAIVVQQQPDDATFDTLDFGVASVRWMMNAEPAFGAIGPRHVDPRSGEILDADIGFEGMQTRVNRLIRTQLLAATPAGEMPVSFAAPLGLLPQGAGHEHCLHADLSAEQTGYALDVLEARGELDPDSPLAQQFVLDHIKGVVMHEVGHTLGMRHNFRASRAYTEAQLSDAEFTRANGTTGSVMEYNAINLSRPGEPAGTPFQLTLGPYDYWAIEYAYKPLPPGSTAADERAELQRIASRSADPLLAFGTDEDAAFGIDPETIQLDLGADPIAFAAKRLDIARDLFRRQETRDMPPERDYSVLRRSLNYAIGDAGRAVGVLARQIGGVRTLRDFPGSGRDPLQPVSAALQRQALDLITRALLSPEGLTVSPALQRKLAPDFQDREDVPGLPTDYTVAQRLLDLQRAVLNQLMSDTVASRILASVGKVDRPADAFQLSELYGRLTKDVWTELGRGGAIGPGRRDLQREHVNRLATALLRPSPLARADTRGLMREQAVALLARIDGGLRNPAAADAETRAHLRDSADSLRQALAAPLTRAGV